MDKAPLSQLSSSNKPAPFEKLTQKIYAEIAEYFKKDKFAIYEAAAILGAQWQFLEKKPVAETKDKMTAVLIDRLFGMYMENFSRDDTEYNSYTHDYYYNPHYETDVYYHGKIPPKDAVQLAVDSGFDFPSIILRYLSNNNLLPEPDEYSLIRIFYRKWANMKLWSLDEASLLLFGFDPDEESIEFRFFKYQPEYIIREIGQVKKYLKKAALSGDIKYVMHDTIFMNPVAILKWATANKYNIPRLLTEEISRLGNINSDKAVTAKNKRGCKTQIIAEFEKRAADNKIFPTWEEEIKYLQKFADTLGETYTLEALKNIIRKMQFQKHRASQHQN